MEIFRSFLKKACILLVIAFLLFLPSDGYPVRNVTDLRLETISDNSSNSIMGKPQNSLNCKMEIFSAEDVLLLNDSDIFLKAKNITVHSSDYLAKDGKMLVCLDSHENNKTLSIADCKNKFAYDRHEFEVFPNRSALLYGEVLSPEEYVLKDGQLLTCTPDVDYEDDISVNNSTHTSISLSGVSITIGKIGSGISIAALIIHLLIFSFLPTLHNLPGYNLASLSVAFLFAYSFNIIGQIPEVLGVSCIVSGVLQQNFFLVAFFCMNVMAFDVWRTLKLATKKLRLGSNNFRKRQFLWYSLYAWGLPLIISSSATLADNISGVPEKIKPHFGRYDICWMTNGFAKAIFFAIPAFTLFVINAIFFISSSFMISNNSMESTNDQHKQSVKFNYVLYVRLGLMMGLTWLAGVVALIWKNDIVWLIHDLLNSLQGLFLFLLFTCTKKVMKHLKEKFNKNNSTQSSSENKSTCSSKVEAHQF